MLRLFIEDILPFTERKHTRSKSTRRPSSERNYQDAVRNQLSSNFVDQIHLTQHPEGVLLQDHRRLCHSRSHPGQLIRQEEGTSATPGIKVSYIFQKAQITSNKMVHVEEVKC